MKATYKEVYEWCLEDDECLAAIFLVSLDDVKNLVAENIELDPRLHTKALPTNPIRVHKIVRERLARSCSA